MIQDHERIEPSKLHRPAIDPMRRHGVSDCFQLRKTRSAHEGEPQLHVTTLATIDTLDTQGRTSRYEISMFGRRPPPIPYLSLSLFFRRLCFWSASSALARSCFACSTERAPSRTRIQAKAAT